MNRILLIFALCLTGCATAPSSTSITAQIFTPANIAAATKDSLTIAASLFLHNNPSYSGEVRAAADAFTALAVASPSSLTTGDISATLAKTSLPSTDQEAIALAVSASLTIYQNDFATKLPGLKPQYAAFAQAIADGLNGALPSPAAGPPPP